MFFHAAYHDLPHYGSSVQSLVHCVSWHNEARSSAADRQNVEVARVVIHFWAIRSQFLRGAMPVVLKTKGSANGRHSHSMHENYLAAACHEGRLKSNDPLLFVFAAKVSFPPL